jgi:NADPH-dependent 2,4-dienoyl-CoA reductase/sulfur reductase-like enzyme
LHQHGAIIVAIAEQAPWQQVCRFGLALIAHPDKLWQGAVLKLRLSGVPYRFGVWPVGVEGEQQVRRVKLTNGSRAWYEECDVLACAFGLVPNTELASALGCELRDGFVKVDRYQATSLTNVCCAGEPAGIGGADCALVEGQIAGYAAAGKQVRAEPLFDQRQKWHQFRVALAQGFALRSELKSLASPETLVCRCEDVPFGKLRQFSNWRDAKLQTRCGMGPCQGRICGPATKFVLGWGMESVRPPIMPVRVRNLIMHLPSEGVIPGANGTPPLSGSSTNLPRKQPIAHET